LSTPEKILDAAAEEFAKNGRTGTRMEHVARRAGVNKALVYRHFGDKDGLFVATLTRAIASRKAFIQELPDDLATMLSAWTRRQADDTPFIQLIAREGLDYTGEPPIEADAREAYYQGQIDVLKKLQASGDINPDFDTDALFFALLLLTVGPVLLPQIQRLVMSGPDRDARWESFLDTLAEALQARETS
jgi:AcrR family transcriptional regulator